MIDTTFTDSSLVHGLSLTHTEVYMVPWVLTNACLKKNSLYLFEMQNYRNSEENQLLHLLVLFPDDHNSQSLTRPKPGAKSFCMDAGVLLTGAFAALPYTLRGGWIRGEAAISNTGANMGFWPCRPWLYLLLLLAPNA